MDMSMISDETGKKVNVDTELQEIIDADDVVEEVN